MKISPTTLVLLVVIGLAAIIVLQPEPEATAAEASWTCNLRDPGSLLGKLTEGITGGLGGGVSGGDGADVPGGEFTGCLDSLLGQDGDTMTVYFTFVNSEWKTLGQPVSLGAEGYDVEVTSSGKSQPMSIVVQNQNGDFVFTEDFGIDKVATLRLDYINLPGVDTIYIEQGGVKLLSITA